MQPETGLKRKMVAALEEDGWLVRLWPGNAYSRKGVPDMLAIKDGFHCWIEVKRAGERLAPAQVVEHATLKGFGAAVFTAYTPEGAVAGANSLRPVGRKTAKKQDEIMARLGFANEIPGSR